MRRSLLLLSPLAALSMGCGPKNTTTPSAPQGALSGLAAQRIVVLPAFAADIAPVLGWSSARPSEVLRQLDADIVDALEERGVKQSWVFPEALRQSHVRNPTYTADPFALGMQPMRGAGPAVGTRLPEPLASQLRTIVALHDARYVLAPIELRLDTIPRTSGASAAAAAPAMGRAVLKLALLDARASETRWVGQIIGDSASSYGPVVTASVAAKLAGLVVSP
jgi:hypothetical protein